ncbi:phage tail tape measure protein [Pseudomonas plecoglossicida]|uniref:Phage tail tape measure protein n=2 Tax=Pseudomonas plecoglossicida TaxID=70775 RepID=A0A2A3LX39_PSEDL|nr:phage tail tape measure protein [Pseudomonas plecoglossicida]
MTRAGDAAAASADDVSGSLEDQRKALTQLLGQINPTTAALGRLDDMQERLAKFKKAGIVESDTFVEYTQRINTMRDALGETSDGMNKAGMSAKAYNAALRGIPAQFTDIAVSLQGGQAPLTVFLQQGGQLKDMFGGIAPAARAMGGYILGLVNPFTVAAAAAATLGLVFYDVEKQISAFNKALFSGSADSGQTVESMAVIAMSVADITGDLSEAKNAVIALGASGRVSEIQFRNLAQASASIAQFTGQSATDVAKSFGGLGDSATKAAQKISEQYGLITSAQYEVIAGLESQGRKQEALDALSESLNANAQKRLQRYRDSLSELERDWDDVGTAISNAYSKIKAELFPDDNKQIEIAQRILDTRKQGGFTGALSNLFSFGDNTNQALRTQIKTLTERREAAAAAAKAESAETDANQGRIAAAARWASSQLEYLDKESRKRSEIAEARELGLKAGRSEEEIAKRIVAIESKYADKAKPKTPREDNRGVAEAQNTFSRLYSQYDPAAQAARALTKEQGQLDLALSKGKISQEEYGKALAQASLNYAAAIKGAQGLTQAEQYRAQLQKQLDGEKSQYDLDAASVGMGSLQAERMQQRIQLEQQVNDRIKQLRTELANATTAGQRQELQTQIDQENEFLQKRIAAQRDGWTKIDQAQASWSAGAQGAFQDYLDSASDVAGQTRSMFSSAFSNMEDGIVNFVKTGKLSFKDFADQVVADLIRIQVRQAAAGFLGSAFGFLSGGSQALGQGTMTGFSEPLKQLSTGGYTGDGGKFEPKGVVHGGEYVLRKEVVAQPGMRDYLDRLNQKGYASGGYVGPVSSSSDSGVSVETSAGQVQIVQHITVQGTADDATLARIQQAAQKGAQDGYNLVLRDFKMNGPARQLIARNR